MRVSPEGRYTEEHEMAVVNVMVNTRAYTIACDDGEEDHLRELAGHVDSRVKELLSSVGQVGDSRLLLMAALLITDDMFEAQRKLPDSPQRTELFDRMTRLIVAYAPFRLTVHVLEDHLFHDNVRNFKPHPIRAQVWQYIEIADSKAKK
jgi:cell division protein ZapA (FtsZ GTPase activity inhibitor)